MKDQEKKNQCKLAGITLIQIPYWWDHTLESLVASIQKERPELCKGYITREETEKEGEGGEERRSAFRYA